MTFAFKSRIFQFRVIFLALVALCCLGLSLSYYYRNKTVQNIRDCFRKSTNEEIEALKTLQIDIPNLLGDVLVATPKVVPGRTIFFHDTSCHADASVLKNRFNFVNLTSRAACAVESAALHNPNLDIFVLFASPTYWDNTATNPTLDAIISYPNVQLRNLDLWSYAAETPLAQWFESEQLFYSKYVISHMSDFLRYLTLWRFGGTYLDMDVVVLRTLEDLPPNYTGAESYDNIAAGVMNFGLDKIGRKVAEYCLNDFKQNYNGRIWGTNGPGVITRTLKHFCRTNNVNDMFDKKRCSGFQVYPPDVFYAIPWIKWKHYFEEKHKLSTLGRIDKSIIAHVWNQKSKKQKLNINETTSAYGYLAAKHCPKVFKAIRDHF